LHNQERSGGRFFGSKVGFFLERYHLVVPVQCTAGFQSIEDYWEGVGELNGVALGRGVVDGLGVAVGGKVTVGVGDIVGVGVKVAVGFKMALAV